jgi:hypothetical protein
MHDWTIDPTTRRLPDGNHNGLDFGASEDVNSHIETVWTSTR